MDAIQSIRSALRNRNLIPFVGAGVSRGAAAIPSWNELLDRGTEYLRKHRKTLGITGTSINALTVLSNSGQLVTAFQSLQNLLGGTPHGDHYRAFLYEQFGAPVVSDSRTLDALRKLEPRIVVTTNYDALLSKWRVPAEDSLVTWLEPKRMLSMLRSQSGVIHLHGRYDVPESVILSDSDYSRIVHGPKESRMVAQALFHSGVLLFVGASLDGTQDPHLSRLLGEFVEVHGPVQDDSRSPHFILLRSDTDSLTRSVLHRHGIELVDYGDSFDDLPRFLNDLVEPEPIRVSVAEMRPRFHALRTALSVTEVLSDVKHYIETQVFPHRQVRIAFSEKIVDDGRFLLRSVDPLPPKALHHTFSYPQTLAAWALIEGRIFSYPRDLDHQCDFALLERLNKLARVQALLQATAASDVILSRFLDADAIRARSAAGSLCLRDLYQHWVGKQPRPHYDQFVSVPVPLVDLLTVTEQAEPPEYCVINIDTLGGPPLLDERTEAMLELASDMAALAYERIGTTSSARKGA